MAWDRVQGVGFALLALNTQDIPKLMGKSSDLQLIFCRIIPVASPTDKRTEAFFT
jgi:hypothetical protein